MKDLPALKSRAASRPADPVTHAELAAAMAAVDPEAAADHVEKAKDLVFNCLRFGATAVACEAAATLALAFPTMDLRVLYAETLVHNGETPRARGLLEEMVGGATHQEDTVRPRVALAALCLADDPAAALEWVEPVAEVNAESRTIYLQSLLAAVRLPEAVEFGKRAIEAVPDAPELYQFYGAALMESGALEQAVEAFAESLRLDPEQVGAHFNLTVALARQGAFPGALGVADAGLARDPKDAPLAQLKADILTQLAK